MVGSNAAAPGSPARRPTRARRASPSTTASPTHEAATIFGGLVPYGEVWRVGANWATRLTLDLDVRIGDLDVPRGEYTLFLRPREDGADLIVSLETRQWGHRLRPVARLWTGIDGAPGTGRDHAKHGHHARAQPSSGENEDVPSGTLRVTWGHRGVLHQLANPLAVAPSATKPSARSSTTAQRLADSGAAPRLIGRRATMRAFAEVAWGTWGPRETSAWGSGQSLV